MAADGAFSIRAGGCREAANLLRPDRRDHRLTGVRSARAVYRGGAALQERSGRRERAADRAACGGHPRSRQAGELELTANGPRRHGNTENSIFETPCLGASVAASQASQLPTRITIFPK